MFEASGHAFVFQIDCSTGTCDLAGVSAALLDRFGEGRISVRISEEGQGFLGCIEGCNREEAVRLIEGLRDLSLASPGWSIQLGGWGSALPPTRMQEGSFELFAPVYESFCQPFRGLHPASLERYP